MNYLRWYGGTGIFPGFVCFPTRTPRPIQRMVGSKRNQLGSRFASITLHGRWKTNNLSVVAIKPILHGSWCAAGRVVPFPRAHPLRGGLRRRLRAADRNHGAARLGHRVRATKGHPRRLRHVRGKGTVIELLVWVTPWCFSPPTTGTPCPMVCVCGGPTETGLTATYRFIERLWGRYILDGQQHMINGNASTGFFYDVSTKGQCKSGRINRTVWDSFDVAPFICTCRGPRWGVRANGKYKSN